MRPRSNIGSTADIGRLGLALRGPGVDTRIWCSLAVVNGDLTTDPPGIGIDTAQGIFVSVILLPSQHSDTARLGSSYAGVNVGLLFPISNGDEVLVMAPSGDPDEGLVIAAKLWSASDLQPAGWNNDSVTLLSDQPIQFVSDKVRVGAQPIGTNPGANVDYADEMIIGTTYRNAEETEHSSEENAYQALITAMGVCITAMGTWATAAAALVTANSVPMPSASGIAASLVNYGTAAGTGITAVSTAASAVSTAATALQAALQTFEATGSSNNSYLSNSAQVGK
jgi:Type VI secretion system/phage-baseplate injector OB domain